MTPRAFVLALVLIAFPAVALAQFYRYVDEQGKIRYTDDLANVPADQRSAVREYEEPDTEPPPKKENEKKKEEAETPKAPVVRVGGAHPVEQALREKLGKLQAEYQALMGEREELADEKATSGTLEPEAHKELTHRILDFNVRMKDHEERWKALNKEIEAYNATITEEAEPPEADKE